MMTRGHSLYDLVCLLWLYYDRWPIDQVVDWSLNLSAMIYNGYWDSSTIDWGHSLYDGVCLL